MCHISPISSLTDHKFESGVRIVSQFVRGSHIGQIGEVELLVLKVAAEVDDGA